MDVLISLLSDLSILIFDLALYMQLTPLAKENRLYKGLMHGGVTLITAAYVIAAYLFHVPYGLASFLCMSVPSFLLFLCLSKYKNARFLVTFCFVDNVTFIIAAVAKIILLECGTLGGILSCIFVMVLCSIIFFAVRPYCPKYRALMEQVPNGWVPMAVSTVLIYLILIISTTYPTPMIQRMEYVPVDMLLCLTILSFYVVFIVLIQQKAKLTQAYALLQQQQCWHDMAYLDELTQLANRAAYDARISRLEHEKAKDQDFALMIFDIDNFKHVNDTYGHHFGDVVLKKSAEYFLNTFPKDHYEFFRIGGDEFAAIVTGLPEKTVQEAAETINTMPMHEDLPCTYSCGFAQVNPQEISAFEQAFIRADKAMYEVKTSKKVKR